ncbi:MAG: hypothetical protein JKX78_13385 [Alteromonadaceae bacterium]|nr:hypothetical protein [Alteromonadaceae bacterium]
MKNIILLIITLFSFSAVAGDDFFDAYQQKINYKEATAFKNFIEKRGISFGAEILPKSEHTRLFGAEFDDDGIVLMVAITNDTRYRLLVGGRDVKLTGTNNESLGIEDFNVVMDLIDPSDADSLGKTIFTGYFKILSLGIISLAQGDTEDQVRRTFLRQNLIKKSFQYAILEPGDSQLGIVVFNKEQWSKINGKTLTVAIQNLKRVAYLNLQLPLKDIKEEKSWYSF